MMITERLGAQGHAVSRVANDLSTMRDVGLPALCGPGFAIEAIAQSMEIG